MGFFTRQIDAKWLVNGFHTHVFSLNVNSGGNEPIESLSSGAISTASVARGTVTHLLRVVKSSRCIGYRRRSCQARRLRSKVIAGNTCNYTLFLLNLFDADVFGDPRTGSLGVLIYRSCARKGRQDKRPKYFTCFIYKQADNFLLPSSSSSWTSDNTIISYRILEATQTWSSTSPSYFLSWLRSWQLVPLQFLYANFNPPLEMFNNKLIFHRFPTRLKWRRGVPVGELVMNAFARRKLCAPNHWYVDFSQISV